MNRITVILLLWCLPLCAADIPGSNPEEVQGELSRQNYFDRLQLPHDAAPWQIQYQFYKLSEQYKTSPFAREIVKLLDQAREVLLDPKKRSEYEGKKWILQEPVKVDASKVLVQVGSIQRPQPKTFEEIIDEASTAKDIELCFSGILTMQHYSSEAKEERWQLALRLMTRMSHAVRSLPQRDQARVLEAAGRIQQLWPDKRELLDSMEQVVSATQTLAWKLKFNFWKELSPDRFKVEKIWNIAIWSEIEPQGRHPVLQKEVEKLAETPEEGIFAGKLMGTHWEGSGLAKFLESERAAALNRESKTRRDIKLDRWFPRWVSGGITAASLATFVGSLSYLANYASPVDPPAMSGLFAVGGGVGSLFGSSLFLASLFGSNDSYPFQSGWKLQKRLKGDEEQLARIGTFETIAAKHYPDFVASGSCGSKANDVAKKTQQ